MKSYIKSGSYFSRSLLITVLIVIIAFSCKKSGDNDTGTNNANKYCSDISWSNSAGQSGTFTGTYLAGSYLLTNIEFKESGVTAGFLLNYDANNHLISDQTGITYTYTQDYLSRILITGRTGAGTYNFDSNSHLTTGEINVDIPGVTGTLNATYTYDSNDDPVKISATGSLSTIQGPVTVDVEITGDYLTDKAGLLPFIPVFAPASSYFSFVPFISKHLLNKWVATITESLNGIPVIAQDLTIQYTYSFDADGNVITMENSVVPGNVFTFTYAGCK